MDFDLIIIGGGPAGATLARLLPRKMHCAVIYRCDLSKPCGGLLSEDAQRSLARYDITLPKDVLVDPQIFSVKTIDLEAGLVRHYQRTYLNMDRQKFDAWLLDMVPCQRIDGQVIAVERLTEGYRMTLLETLALLTFILTLLGLIVDVIRLTVEVMAKFSQTKSDDNKKD